MALEPQNTVWFDGKLTSLSQATVPITTHALHYGTSAFEGIRAYWNDDNLYIFRLNDHVRRLQRSGTFYNIMLQYSHEEICDAIIQTCKTNKMKEDTYIRPLYFVGDHDINIHVTGEALTHMAVIIFPLKQYHDENGISACLSSYRRFSDQATPVQAKMAGNYLNSIIATSEAKRNGFQEAIMLDHSGNISETPGANIFLVQNGTLVTPDAASSALDGITRDTVMWLAARDNIKTVQRRVSPSELYTSDEIFITGTATEVVPIIKIGEHSIGAGPITNLLMNRYRDLVMGRGNTPLEWITPVYQ